MVILPWLELGPAIIFTSHLLYLLPTYYLLNALILDGRTTAEWTMRNAFLQSQALAIAAEILWSGIHPLSLSRPACAVAAAVSAVLQGAHLSLAFGASEGIYCMSLALPLQATSNLAWIPVVQVGYNYTLERQISPARYRIIAWLVAVGLAAAVLLTPICARAWLAVPVSLLPACVVVLLFALAGDRLESSNGTAGETRPAAKAIGASGLGQLRVGPDSAAGFLLLGCCSGTLGEAVTDMAFSLAIRESLIGGRRDLALANQLAIFVSMSLAYISETRPGGGALQWGRPFILAWAACQILRSFALHLVRATGTGVPVLLVGVCALFDKYTGPLGSAALDIALLAILKRGAVTVQADKRQISVPGTLLWTMRNGISRLERPICQLVLLRTSGIPVGYISGVLALATTLGVLAVLSLDPEPVVDQLEESHAKKE